MKYIITNCSSGNNWLDTKVNVYEPLSGFQTLKSTTSLISLSASPLIEHFNNVITYFVTLGGETWGMKTITVRVNGTEYETEEEYYEDVFSYVDEDDTTITETITGYRTVVINTRPHFDVKLKKYLYDVSNTEKVETFNTKILPELVHDSLATIWSNL